MGSVWQCDAGCGAETEDLKGWRILSVAGERPKLVLCSRQCVLAIMAREAAKEAQSEAKTDQPRRRRWRRLSRSSHSSPDS